MLDYELKNAGDTALVVEFGETVDRNVSSRVVALAVNAGFFLADAFHSFSRLTLSRLKVLVESQLRDISHVLLSHPRIDGDLPVLRETLLQIRRDQDAGAAEGDSVVRVSPAASITDASSDMEGEAGAGKTASIAAGDPATCLTSP